MAKWDVAGTWFGEYSYDPHPAFPAHPSPVGFTLSARLGWWGRVHGTIQDDPDGGHEPAAMTGRACGTRLSFRKLYLHYYVFHMGKLATMAEVFEANEGIALDEAPPAQPIWYRGVYDETKEVVSGTWRIKPGRISMRASGQEFAMVVELVTGTWSMRRQRR